jgi:large repetitive protein
MGSAISASLLAESAIPTINPARNIVDHDPVRHNGFEVNTFPLLSDTIELRSSQVSLGQIGAREIGQDHFRVSQVSISEIGASKLSHEEVSTPKISIGQIGTSEVNVAQVSFAEVGSTQINVIQTSSGKIGSTQINSTQNIASGIVVLNTVNSDSTITQIAPTEISFSSSVSPIQLLSSNLSHTNTSLLTSIYSTAQTHWHTTTPIDLNFAITNLPTGQLAEGTITSYNTNGTPKTATISIDDDANGVGWFLDTISSLATPPKPPTMPLKSHYSTATPSTP